MAAQYFIRRGEKIVSLASLDQLKSNIAKGKVVATDEVALKKDGPWKIIADVPAFSALFSEQPIGDDTPLNSDIPPEDPLGSVSVDEIADFVGEMDYQPVLSPTASVAREKKLPTKRGKKAPSNDDTFLTKTNVAASAGIIALLVVVVVMAVSFWPEDPTFGVGSYFEKVKVATKIQKNVSVDTGKKNKNLLAAASRPKWEDAPRAQLRKIVDHLWDTDNRRDYAIRTGFFDPDAAKKEQTVANSGFGWRTYEVDDTKDDKEYHTTTEGQIFIQLTGYTYDPTTKTCTLTIKNVKSIVTKWPNFPGNDAQSKEMKEGKTNLIVFRERVTAYFGGEGWFDSGRWYVEKVEETSSLKDSPYYEMKSPGRIVEGYFELLFAAVK